LAGGLGRANAAHGNRGGSSPPTSAFGHTLRGGTGLSPSRLSPQRKASLHKRSQRSVQQHEAVTALLAPADVRVLDAYDEKLKQIFHHYSRTVSAVRGVASAGATFGGLSHKTTSLDLASVSVFCRDANIVPLLATRQQLTEAFRLSNRGLNADLDPLAISFPEFKECVARLALAAYPRTRNTPSFYFKKKIIQVFIHLVFLQTE
jgi:hypothetical protein